MIFQIYIPVWIDLKTKKFIKPARFTNIYIPVWIDLKDLDTTKSKLVLNIYIPVWIDLKNTQKAKPELICFNLHSSMDRFEVSKIYAQCRPSIIYIPVWIDLKSRISCLM